MQFFTRDSLDAEGRMFLSDRGLSIPVAQQMGVASANGEIAFPFISNGQIVRVKYRNMEDKKKMRMNSIKEEEKANFKMPFWNQRIWPTSDYLIVTEGEFDAIAIAQLGANKVVSLPNGAQSVQSTFRNQYDYLQNFDLIYLAFDMDESGNKAVEEAKKLLPPKKFRRINFPAKDANEWIQENPDVCLEDLENLMRNATRICVDEIVHLKDLPYTFFEARNQGIPTGWRSIDRYIGGIRDKELTVVSADTGVGKTTFSINLLCNLIKQNPSGFWINSWEMDYEVIVRKVASVVLGTKFKTEEFNSDQRKTFINWMNKHNALINPKRSKADTSTLHRQIDLASKVYGVKYILLDHLDYISATSKLKDNHEKITEAIVALHEMAMEFEVHIFLIAHANQSVDGSGKVRMNQLKGSSSIKQYSDNIFLLHNPHQEDLSAETDNRMIVSIPKNRFFGRKGEAVLRYLPESDSYMDNLQILETRSTHEN